MTTFFVFCFLLTLQVDCFHFVMVAIDAFISDAASFHFRLDNRCLHFQTKKSTFDVNISFLDACRHFSMSQVDCFSFLMVATFV